MRPLRGHIIGPLRIAGAQKRAVRRVVTAVCSSLALVSTPHLLAAQDVKQLARDCDAENAAACYTLGLMYSAGEGVTQDLALAATLQQKACDEQHGPACYALGFMYARGQGLAQNLAQAATVFHQACEGEHAPACAVLGIMYYEGVGVTQDLARAATLQEKGCVGGDAQACHTLGLMYARGEGVTQDVAHATRLQRRACERGHAEACSAEHVSKHANDAKPSLDPVGDFDISVVTSEGETIVGEFSIRGLPGSYSGSMKLGMETAAISDVRISGTRMSFTTEGPPYLQRSGIAVWLQRDFVHFRLRFSGQNFRGEVRTSGGTPATARTPSDAGGLRGQVTGSKRTP